MKYIIYAKVEAEIEAADKEEAKKIASEKFDEAEKVGVKITEARVADKASGFFLE